MLQAREAMLIAALQPTMRCWVTDTVGMACVSCMVPVVLQHLVQPQGRRGDGGGRGSPLDTHDIPLIVLGGPSLA